MVVVVCGTSVIARAADDPYERAETLAAQRQFDEAERAYRAALATRPRDWRLRLGLARVILWDERYREAEKHFVRLVNERPREAAPLLGYAQAAYWSGDFRSAQRRYSRLLAAHPDHAEAKKALADLAIVSAPRYEVAANYRHDSQPYRFSTGRTIVSYFSDPLTRWDFRLGAGSVTGGDTPIGSVGAGVSAGIPALRLTAEGRVERFRFPDDEAEIIGSFSLTRRLPARSAIVATVEKLPLLWTASAVTTHTTATQYTLGWRRDPDQRWVAAANAHRADYSDGNEGSGADAWLLAPLFSCPAVTIRGGLSAAWRDTELDRFRFTNFSSERIAANEYRYMFTGVYDPYWTPQDLQEGRLVVVADFGRVKIHADGGLARDRAVGFGPEGGSTPAPTFIFPLTFERTFRPWRAGFEVTWPLAGLELRARYRHDVTAFYRANEFETSLVGRF